ncbi:MAG TPA: hypothetical protein EYG94_04145 [Campylobacterales bacterium]|nr:hypothetical protein [Campylobacterales bacterium]
MKPSIITILLLSSLCIAETEFNLEKEKSNLSHKVFTHYDLDKSKTLSFEEFSAFSKEMRQKEQEKQIERTLSSCDKNSNGKIELSEVPTEEEMHEAFSSRVDRKKMLKMCHMNQRRFKTIDKDEDGTIDKEEILLSYTQHFVRWGAPMMPPSIEKRDVLKDFKAKLKRCDKNKDGEITLIEATSVGCYMPSEEFLTYSPNPKKSFKIEDVKEAPKHDENSSIEIRFKRCDNNSDKKLNLVEATSRICMLPSDEFIKLDKDNNKYLSKSEMLKRYTEINKRVPMKISKKMPPIVQISIAFGQCDEDKDKKISKEEAESCSLPMETFEKFDSDNSNTIEQNDMKNIQAVEEFDMVDMNSNKKIEPKEFEERMGNRCRVF